MMNIIVWMYLKTMGVPGSLNSETTVFNQWRVLILGIFSSKNLRYEHTYIYILYPYYTHDLSYKKALRGLQRPTQQPASCDGPETTLCTSENMVGLGNFLGDVLSWHIFSKKALQYLYWYTIYLYHSISISIHLWWSLCFYRVSYILIYFGKFWWLISLCRQNPWILLAPGCQHDRVAAQVRTGEWSLKDPTISQDDFMFFFNSENWYIYI